MPRTEPLPDRPTVVVAGGGVAALEAMLALRATSDEAFAIELVSPETHFWYRPLAVTEPFGLGEAVRFPLVDLARDAGATVTLGEVARVDAGERTVELAHGQTLAYDRLLLATGARAVESVPGALTFRGPADGEAMAELLLAADAGAATEIAFTAPTGATWHIPLYELVLLTDRWLRERGRRALVGLHLVTPEDRPLAAFGGAASAAVEAMLDEREIHVLTGRHPSSFADGVLTVIPRASLRASHVVALPRLEGSAPEGVPRDRHGFVAVDEVCRVRGIDGVFAAGDMTTLPVKQGGLAAQQADAAATAIAAELGAGVAPEPFRPVLRGLLLTGETPRYLRSEPGSGLAAIDVDPLWWPPAKIVGKHLAPYLAARTGAALDVGHPSGAIPVEVALHG